MDTSTYTINLRICQREMEQHNGINSPLGASTTIHILIIECILKAVTQSRLNDTGIFQGHSGLHSKLYWQ